MRDYLNGDIDSSCGSLSREDPMLFGIPRRVVRPLIICDSSVRDAQMTRYFSKKKARGVCFKWKRLLQLFKPYMSGFNLIMGKTLLVYSKLSFHVMSFTKAPAFKCNI